MTFESVLQSSASPYANFSARIGKNHNGESYINCSISYGYEITKMTVLFKFSIPQDKNDNDFQKILVNSNVNVCKMMSGVMGDFLSKMIMEDLKKCSNIDLKCPIPKVSFTVLILKYFLKSFFGIFF